MPHKDNRAGTALDPQAPPSAGAETEPGGASADAAAVLEARLERLESGQVKALTLVAQALSTLRHAQGQQSGEHMRAVARLGARLGECEAALARLTAAQQRDDEVMRERLFDLGEALQGVRMTAASAVRPAALHKLERSLQRDVETRTVTLREEFEERVAEAVEAAEGRSADALDTLEQALVDDMTELARRFDCLADDVGSLRADEDDVAAEREQGAAAPVSGPFADEIETEAPRPEAPSAVIPFPATEPVGTGPAPGETATLLALAARRAEAASAPAERAGTGRPALLSLHRMVTNAGSAVIAVCIMGGMSLLAGPALGPGLHGTPTAFAEEAPDWTPVAAEPQPIAVPLKLKPVLRSRGKPQPERDRKDDPSGD